MTIEQRLLDTAQMRTQYPEWLCKEMEAAAEEIMRLRNDAYAREVRLRALVERWRDEGRHLSNPKLLCSDELELEINGVGANAGGKPRE